MTINGEKWIRSDDQIIHVIGDKSRVYTVELLESRREALNQEMATIARALEFAADQGMLGEENAQ